MHQNFLLNAQMNYSCTTPWVLEASRIRTHLRFKFQTKGQIQSEWIPGVIELFFNLEKDQKNVTLDTAVHCLHNFGILDF